MWPQLPQGDCNPNPIVVVVIVVSYRVSQMFRLELALLSTYQRTWNTQMLLLNNIQGLLGGGQEQNCLLQLAEGDFVIAFLIGILLL